MIKYYAFGMRFEKSFMLWVGVLVLSAVLPFASAQQSGNQGGGSGNSGSGSNTTSPKTIVRPTIPVPPQPSQQAPQRIEQPVFLAGTVVTEDGSAPPFGAFIEMVCRGTVTREANVAPNGYFTFQVGGDEKTHGFFPDASQGSDAWDNENFSSASNTAQGTTSPGSGPRAANFRKPARLFGCDIRAQLHGYKSTSLTISEEPLPGPNQLGTIVVYPLERVQGTTVSITSMMAPKSARKLVDQSEKALRKNRFSDAEAFLKSAVKEYPKYSEAWFELGQLYERQERDKEAYDVYHQAIEADRLYVKPYLRLAQLALARQQWRDAADLSGEVLTLDPITLVGGYYVNAVAHLNLSELEIAETRARRGQRLDFSNRYPQLHLVLANILALRLDTAGSIKELRNYLRAAPDAPNTPLIRSQIRKMEEQSKLANK